MVPVVTDVPVSPSSVVTEFVMNSPGIRIGNLLNRRPLPSPKSAQSDWAISQEEMRYEGTPVKAPPISRRRTMPPTPQQSSHSSIEDMQWQAEMEVQGSSWNARGSLREWSST